MRQLLLVLAVPLDAARLSPPHLACRAHRSAPGGPGAGSLQGASPGPACKSSTACMKKHALHALS
eukprot:scaffold35115_cov57-Phaeocystis_antarctica.AAC.2